MKRKVSTLCMLVCLGSMVCLGGAAAAEPQDAGEQPLRLAGLLDKLMDSESKEGQILQGVGSILGSTSELDYKSERTIGESLALEGFRRYGMPVQDADLQKYINLVGNAVARNSLRPEIPYTFVVLDNPLQNAFSCPGGIIFISSGLLKTIRDEAQLAGILAHEVAHVGHKHALQSIQRAQFFQGVGTVTSATMKGEKGKEFETMIGSLQVTLFDKGLDQKMEFEADRSAMETAYRTGYDPVGIIEVLREMKKIEAQSQKQGSWFSTHPPLGDRIRRCEAEMGRYPDATSLARLPDRYKSRAILQQPRQGKMEKTKPR